MEPQTAEALINEVSRRIQKGNAGAPAAAFLSVVRKRPPGLALLAKTRGLLKDS
jgi:hypothetical protein